MNIVSTNRSSLVNRQQCLGFLMYRVPSVDVQYSKKAQQQTKLNRMQNPMITVHISLLYWIEFIATTFNSAFGILHDAFKVRRTKSARVCEREEEEESVTRGYLSFVPRGMFLWKRTFVWVHLPSPGEPRGPVGTQKPPASSASKLSREKKQASHHKSSPHDQGCSVFSGGRQTKVLRGTLLQSRIQNLNNNKITFQKWDLSQGHLLDFLFI